MTVAERTARTRSRSEHISADDNEETPAPSASAQLAQETESEWSSDSDSDFEQVINYKNDCLSFPAFLNESAHPVGRQAQKLSFARWKENVVPKVENMGERFPFHPCSHPGRCKDAMCPCFRQQIACELACSCPDSCERRYRGCSCHKGGDHQVCVSEKNPGKGGCECRALNRECDVDLCGPCGAKEALSHASRATRKARKHLCSNVHIQKGWPKRTVLGTSHVHGFGLFAGEKIEANDFLGEYKGEIVTSEEAERRGTIYARLPRNYLFVLCKGHSAHPRTKPLC